MIDFKKYVLEYKEDFIRDLVRVLKINSELTVFDPKSKTPFGEGIDEVLRLFLQMAEKDGFKTTYVDGYAGDITLGEQKPWVGTIGHLDVVPAGINWTYPPYEAKIVNNRIYARGAEDDKGPSVCFYYAMKILKRLQDEGHIKLNKRIKMILACDEESGWRCVDYYFKKYPEQPVWGFIPDADFPLIYAEKGIVDLHLNGLIESKNIHSLHAGARANMVPDVAKAQINNLSPKVSKAFLEYLKQNNFKGKVSDNTLEIEGISAHGSTPWVGKNAIFLLNNFLKQQFDEEIIQIIDKYFTDDFYGKKINIAYTDGEMGVLSSNLGILNYENNHLEIILNIRYPKGTTAPQIKELAQEKISKLKVTIGHDNPLLYFDKNSYLVKTLMDVYKKYTNDTQAQPIVIGGGTFARALHNSVAFGPHFPNRPSYIHNKDEYLEIEDLLQALVIYLESLYLLAS
ncbi:MAG: dipeptidase PepV [Acholeplasmatales bacterium]|jgi:succinyl-diaminopimelate desuccinylase|nr:dipeptidase PepV [Acholeplasmatales bacterium]